MMETPLWSNVPKWMFNYVYEPSEDTFLLLDALETDLSTIKELNPTICLEIGSGSGIVITALAKVLCNSALFLATDKNHYAAKATKLTAEQNNVEIESVITNFADCFQDHLQKQIDLILFNPPYVVTPSDEVHSETLSASWAGGIRGREVIDKFLSCAVNLLSEKGVFYLVIIRENDFEGIAKIMKNYGFQSSVVLSRRSGCEHLSVLRFSKHIFNSKTNLVSEV